MKLIKLFIFNTLFLVFGTLSLQALSMPSFSMIKDGARKTIYKTINQCPAWLMAGFGFASYKTFGLKPTLGLAALWAGLKYAHAKLQAVAKQKETPAFQAEHQTQKPVEESYRVHVYISYDNDPTKARNNAPIIKHYAQIPTQANIENDFLDNIQNILGIALRPTVYVTALVIQETKIIETYSGKFIIDKNAENKTCFVALTRIHHDEK